MKHYRLIEWGQPLQPHTEDTPVPRGSEVLLRLSHCGLCHTDLHVRDGYYELGGGQRLTFAERGFQLPLIPGHEPVGVVEAVGDEAVGVTAGSRYLVNPWIGCGECAMCALGLDNLCPASQPLGFGRWGGFGTHLLVRHPRYLVNIDGLSPAQAAPLACSGLTTYSAIKKLQPLPADDWVAVIGCGGLGLMALAVLRGLGHRRVIACDIDDAKLAVAQAQGAPATCNLQSDGVEGILRLAGGPLYGMLDLVGSAATVGLATAGLRKGGRLVVAGLMGGTAQLQVPLLALREIAIMGSVVGTTADLIELVAMVKRGQIALPAVESRPLAQIESSLADLAAGRIVGRVVLEIDPQSSTR